MAYGSGEMLGWLVEERGIEPHIPVIDKSKRPDGTFSRDDFVYDHRTDAYICPAGKELRRNRRKFQSAEHEPKDTGFAKYGAIKAECDACDLKERCCPKGAPRRILRSEHEGARQMARGGSVCLNTVRVVSKWIGRSFQAAAGIGVAALMYA